MRGKAGTIEDADNLPAHHQNGWTLSPCRVSGNRRARIGSRALKRMERLASRRLSSALNWKPSSAWTIRSSFTLQPARRLRVGSSGWICSRAGAVAGEGAADAVVEELAADLLGQDPKQAGGFLAAAGHHENRACRGAARMPSRSGTLRRELGVAAACSPRPSARWRFGSVILGATYFEPSTPVSCTRTPYRSPENMSGPCRLWESAS